MEIKLAALVTHTPTLEHLVKAIPLDVGHSSIICLQTRNWKMVVLLCNIHLLFWKRHFSSYSPYLILALCCTHLRCVNSVHTVISWDTPPFLCVLLAFVCYQAQGIWSCNLFVTKWMYLSSSNTLVISVYSFLCALSVPFNKLLVFVYIDDCNSVFCLIFYDEMWNIHPYSPYNETNHRDGPLLNAYLFVH